MTESVDTSMKVLLYGSKGWIGGQFADVLRSQEIEFVAATSRADDMEAVSKELDDVKPTHVASFIGRTHGKIGDKEYTTIDYLEQEGKLVENVRDNLYSPILLSMLCKERNIHYTYLGTGCIFKFDETHPFGEENNGFTEEAKPNFFGSSYSIVKGYTDMLMHMFEGDVLNLRIRMPITEKENKRNFITKIVTYEKVCSIPNSMTVLPELLPMALELMRRKHTGSLNFTNPGLVSHNEILEMYKEIVDPDFTWQNFTAEQQREILAADRSNNYLDTTSLEKLFPDIDNIKVSVRKCLEGWKKISVDEPPTPPNTREGSIGVVDKLHEAISAASDLVENDTKTTSDYTGHTGPSPPRTPSPREEQSQEVNTSEDTKIKKD